MDSCETLKQAGASSKVKSPCSVTIELQLLIGWRAVWDDFRNWLDLGLQPAKCDENGRASE
jgi:hypothetical protein